MISSAYISVVIIRAECFIHYRHTAGKFDQHYSRVDRRRTEREVIDQGGTNPITVLPVTESRLWTLGPVTSLSLGQPQQLNSELLKLTI